MQCIVPIAEWGLLQCTFPHLGLSIVSHILCCQEPFTASRTLTSVLNQVSQTLQLIKEARCWLCTTVDVQAYAPFQRSVRKAEVFGGCNCGQYSRRLKMVNGTCKAGMKALGQSRDTGDGYWIRMSWGKRDMSLPCGKRREYRQSCI